MTFTSNKKNISNGIKIDYQKPGTSFDRRPLPLPGNVNVDNISDNEFELIQNIAGLTFNRALKWKPQSFISSLSDLLFNKKLTHNYNTTANDTNINLKKFQNGKISIKISSISANKVLLETFIPHKTHVVWGKREGSARSILLQNLFNAVRYQTEGTFAAS